MPQCDPLRAGGSRTFSLGLLARLRVLLQLRRPRGRVRGVLGYGKHRAVEVLQRERIGAGKRSPKLPLRPTGSMRGPALTRSPPPRSTKALNSATKATSSWELSASRTTCASCKGACRSSPKLTSVSPKGSRAPRAWASRPRVWSLYARQGGRRYRLQNQSRSS